MAHFNYRALGEAGRFQTGSLEAADLDQALERIRQLGITPVRVQARDARKPLLERFARLGPGVGAQDLILLTRQLQTMLEAGLALMSALEILESQTTQPELRDAVVQVRRDIEQGSTLTEALRRHPRSFPALYVHMVHAAEEAGLLDEMLDRIAALLEYEMEMTQRIRAAMFYPCLVVGELVVALIVLLKVVLPRFAALFRNSTVELPLPTRVLIGVSDAIQAHWLVMVLVFGCATAAAVAWARSPRGRETIDRRLIGFPIIGPILQKSTMSRFARVLSALIAAGIPVVRALEMSRDVTGNRAVAREVDRMREGVLAGGGLADPIKNSPLFTPLVAKMMAVGEQTGSIDRMLLRVSAYYDRDVDYAVKNLSSAIEPVLLLVLGAAVLFVALAVFLPMWNLMQVFRH